MNWFSKPNDDLSQAQQLYAATVLAAARLLASVTKATLPSASLLARECHRAQELGHPLTLLRLDLSDWEGVVHSIGAERAQQTREELELVLHGTLRATDILLPSETGSFTILLPGTTCQDAPTVVRNLHQAIQGYRILSPDGAAYYLRLHPWIATASLPDDGSSDITLSEVLSQRLEEQKRLPLPTPDSSLPEQKPPLRLVA